MQYLYTVERVTKLKSMMPESGCLHRNLGALENTTINIMGNPLMG